MKKFYSWISILNDLFWYRIKNSTCLSVESLAVYRIIIGLFLLSRMPQSYSWISDYPQAFFDPPLFSLASLFSGFPAKGVFYFLDSILIASLFCFIAGIKVRYATILYLIFSIIGQSFKYSFGKIDHDVTLYVLLFCMILSGWGERMALVPDKEAKDKSNISKGLSLFAIVLCFAMFTAGIHKSLSWIDFNTNTSGFISWFNDGYYNLGRRNLLAPYVLYIPKIILEVIDYAAVAFELSPLLFLLISRKAWQTWLLIACVFHLSVAFMLNIFFTANAVAYLVFADYTSLYYRVQPLIDKVYIKLLSLTVLSMVFLYKSYQLIMQNTEDEKGSIGIGVDGYYSLFVMVFATSIFCWSVFQSPKNAYNCK